MYITVDIVLGNSLDNTLGRLDMHVFEREVPASLSPILIPVSGGLLGRVVPANQVVDHIGVSNARFDRRGIVQVVFLCIVSVFPGPVRQWTYDEDDTAKITRDLQVALGHVLAEGNDNSASLASYNHARQLQDPFWMSNG